MLPLLRLAMILIFAALAAACSPINVLNALVPDEGYTVAEGIAYGGDPRQKLDVYSPASSDSRTPAAGRPVVVFFYGGSWNRGERGDYKFVAQALASRGIMVVVADYRLYPQVRYPEFLQDSAQAVAWTWRNASAYGGDPQRLFLMGHSAGAYNAAMLALDPRWLGPQGMRPSQLAGWIGLAGPYDFFPASDPEVRPVFHHPDYPAGAQPIEHANRGVSPPALLLVAATDSVVDPNRNTQHLATELRSAGVGVTVKTYEGVGHVTVAAALGRPLRALAPVLADIAAFIETRS